MSCQRDLSQQIPDAKGHYLWFVKETALCQKPLTLMRG
jgi:hypothetical protein